MAKVNIKKHNIDKSKLLIKILTNIIKQYIICSSNLYYHTAGTNGGDYIEKTYPTFIPLWDRSVG